MNPADAPAPPPTIDPVPPGVERPFWSVMIPSYNADGMLEETLRSVLDQDPGADQMQVAVVDDASPGADRAAEIVDRLGGGRVEFHRAAENLGLAGNWNRCIVLARGRWVHLLHQDDLIAPGFYERLGAAAAEWPDLAAAFCRHRIIDERGRELRVSAPERDEAGALDGWLTDMATGQRVQCPAIAVARSTYEQVGGFRFDLRYSLDWEMWARAASAGPVWYEPAILASYREHVANETSRLVRCGSDLADMERGLELILRLHPEADRPALRRRAGRFLGIMAMAGAGALMRDGHWPAGLRRVAAAGRHDPTICPRRVTWGFRIWAVKLWLARLAEAVAGRSTSQGGRAGS